ncbi:MAG: carboxypeptidase regulatory-like domain-containing protein [Planctomycetota bacterium]
MTVTLERYTSRSGGRPTALERIRSDADGSYRFEGLAAEAYSLQAVTTEAVPPPAATLFVRDEDVLHDIDLAAGRAIFGSVIDAATELPIEGATIEVVASAEDRRSTVTDAEGNYRIEAIDSEVNGGGTSNTFLRLIAHAPTHGLEYQWIPVRPSDVDAERFDFRLRRCVAVWGTLRFVGRAKPPEDTEVVVTVRRPHGPPLGMDHLRRIGRVESTGAFVVEGVPADLPTLFVQNGASNSHEPQASLDVRADGWRMPALLLPTIKDDGNGLDVGEIVVRQSASIRGRVVDVSGDPHAGALVYALAQGAWLPDTPSSQRAHTIRTFESTVTDDLGRFRLPEFPAGSVDLNVSVPGGAGARAGVKLELTPGEDRSDVELVLGDGAALEGRVVTERGEPVGGAIVMILGEGAVETRADGSFRAFGLSAGPYEVWGYPSDGVKRSGAPLLRATVKDVPADTRDLEIVLPAGTKVEGRVLRANGDPASGVSLGFETDEIAGGFTAKTSERGEFEAVVPAGITLDVHLRAIDGLIEPWMEEMNPLVASYDPASGPLVLRIP